MIHQRPVKIQQDAQLLTEEVLSDLRRLHAALSEAVALAGHMIEHLDQAALAMAKIPPAGGVE